MKTIKIIMGFLIAAVFLFGAAAHAEAQITISEVMYDLKDIPDADHEWVELYNSGTDSVSLEGWKWNDGASHVLNPPPQNGGTGSLTIPGSGYAILSGNAATFLLDHAGYSGTVIDTVMSLPNVSGTLSIVDKMGTAADTASYSSNLGGDGDGNTIGRIDGASFIATAPTPGASNQAAVASGEIQTTTTTSSTVLGSADQGQLSGTGQAAATAKWYPVKTHITVSTKSMTGTSVVFSERTTGNAGEDLTSGRFVWSFGNGDTRTETSAKSVTYSYQTPGDYVVYLEYYRYFFDQEPDAVDRITVHMFPQTIALAGILDDGSVVFKNTGSEEIDIKGWQLRTADSSSAYAIPGHVIVLPGNKVAISSAAPHMPAGTDDILLFDLNGTLASKYSKSSLSASSVQAETEIVPQAPKASSATTKKAASKTKSTVKKKAVPKTKVSVSDSSSPNYIDSNASSAAAAESAGEKKSVVYTPIIAFAGCGAAFAAAGVLAVAKKLRSKKEHAAETDIFAVEELT